MTTKSDLSPELLHVTPRNAKKTSTFRITGIAPPQQAVLWKAPIPCHPRPYRHRQQDSFQAKETRTDEDDHEIDDDNVERSSSSRCTELESRAVPVEPATTTAPTMKSTILSLTESGCQQYELGHYERAEADFQEALQGCHETSLHAAAVLCGNLGATHLQLGNYRKARLYLQKCLQWKKDYRSTSTVVESMADVMLNIGNVACANLEESVFWYHLALEDAEGNEDKVNALFNLGRVYAQHQHWEQAREFLEQAYGLTKEVHGEHHISMAETFDLLGLVNIAQGKYDQAMIAYTSAMTIHRHLKGPIHRSVAQSLLNVGLLRECKGELSDAWEAYTTAQDLLIRLDSNQDDPLMQVTIRNIYTVEVSIAKQSRDRMQRKKV